MEISNLFEDNREKGETNLRKSQLVMLRLLKIFDYVCEKHNIEYFLSGGSLIGAIRHQGFIPWDDDLDIGMTRENYEKFIKYGVPELPNDVFFQDRNTDPTYPACHSVDGKLRDKYSSMNGDFKKNYPKCHDGIALDIFAYDKAFLPFKAAIIIQNFLFNKIIRSDSARTATYKFLSKYIPLPLVYASNFLCYFSSFKFRSNYLEAKDLAGLKKVQFEDTEFYVPVGYHAYLSRQYGDYMQLPPIEKRKGHHTENPDPFTPCDHKETLNWRHRKVAAIV